MARPFFYHPNNGKKVGTHSGAHFFTIGQRKGINVGGKALPLFVISIDVENNVLYVGQGHDHPGLNRKGLFVKPDEIHAVRPDLEMLVGDERRYKVRIRYRQPLQDATLYRTSDGLYIIFDTPQRGITAGQFAAWYDGNELVGSGVIAE
jgi:tRNA-specific 2-thiouridylase